MLMTYFTTRLALSPLGPVVDSCKSALRTLALASGIINFLTLTGSLFMMQVYDRVLGSQSVPTLLGLSLIAIFAYLFQGWLEALRGRILTLLGEKLDKDLSEKVHATGLKMSLASPAGAQEAGQSFRDLESIRAFVTGQGLIAVLDMPWMLLYVAVATILHPLFGLTTVVTGILLLWLTWKTERESKAPVKEAFDAGTKRTNIVDANLRGAETIFGNGMARNRRRLWAQAHDKYLEAQRRATYIIGGYGSVSKTVRMVLQSFVLGLGAYLAIRGQITPGAIIAASIVVARALSPIDQAIASWRPFTAARDANERLAKLIGRSAQEVPRMTLAPPSEKFSVKSLTVAPPGSQTVTLAGVTFNLKGGDVLGIVGSSGSGKTTLIKAIVGAWRPLQGTITYDGAGSDQWDEETIGRATGYLPQDVQLFEGTIAENISRFDETPDEARIIAAATSAGLDQHIRTKYTKTGYNTQVGPFGSFLAGGLRQRLGLARALYGSPFLLVLDEPNSNLDEDGNAALRKAIREARERKAIVIIVTHRPDVLEEVEYMMVLANGTVEDSGKRETVLPKWLGRVPPKPGDRPASGTRPLPPTLTAAQSIAPLRPPAAAVAQNGQTLTAHEAAETGHAEPVTAAPATQNGERGHAPPLQSWSSPPLRMKKNQTKRGE
jgi:PrtD family type I secretion system ABC transporter